MFIKGQLSAVHDPCHDSDAVILLQITISAFD